MCTRSIIKQYIQHVYQAYEAGPGLRVAGIPAAGLDHELQVSKADEDGLEGIQEYLQVPIPGKKSWNVIARGSQQGLVWPMVKRSPQPIHMWPGLARHDSPHPNHDWHKIARSLWSTRPAPAWQRIAKKSDKNGMGRLRRHTTGAWTPLGRGKRGGEEPEVVEDDQEDNSINRPNWPLHGGNTWWHYD